LKSLTKSIAICCIVENSKGFGNLSRCITLAEELQYNKFNVVFIINENRFAIRELNKRNFSYDIIDLHPSDPSSYSNTLTQILRINELNIVLIDMREYGEQISKYLMNKNFKVIMLDDAWCNKAYADIIFNGTNINRYHKYIKINKKSKIFVGKKYWIIDKNFLRYKKKIKQIHAKKKYHIVVSMGGADPHNLSLFVVRSLQTIENIKITIIAGPFFHNVQKLKRYVIEKKHMSIIFSTQKIWKEFLQADLVISGAGNTLFELATQRIPTMCIATVEHQIPYAKSFSSKGIAVNLGFWRYISKDEIKGKVAKILADNTKRKKMYYASKNLLDGKGSLRISKIINDLSII
jgi:spore coat polysaccharide biosynthesis predicted glycosyltransferase SpsG